MLFLEAVGYQTTIPELGLGYFQVSCWSGMLQRLPNSMGSSIPLGYLPELYKTLLGKMCPLVMGHQPTAQ